MHTWHIHLALKRKQPSGELAALFSASSERSTTSSRTTCQGELNSVLTLAITEDSMELWKQYRSFSRDVTELISAMLVHIRVTCFSKKYMQTESKVIILLSSQSKIMASKEKKILRLILTMLFTFHCLITLKSWMGKSESATLRKSRRLESILPW